LTSTSAALTQTIFPAIVLSPSSLPAGQVGTPYSQTITASGGTGTGFTFSVTGGSLPPGLTLTPGGLLSGTPTTAGPFTFTISATDSSAFVGSQTYSPTIFPAIVVSPSSLPAGQVGTPYSQTITATGGTGTGFTFSVTGGSLPPGLTLTPGGLLSGTPTTAGNFSFTVTATDSGAFIGSQGYSVAIVNMSVNAVHYYAIGADQGGGPEVKVYDAATGALKLDFFAYDAKFTGGVRVAIGDVNGDGTPDIITAAGPGGGPHVKAFSGKDGSQLASFFAYDPGFTGGVNVAAGDVNGDGVADIITGAGPGGGPHVKTFDGRTDNQLLSFFAYNAAFSGGVSVAAGDVRGIGRADIITGAGPGGGPHVNIFDGLSASLVATYYAYDPSFQGGVSVAAGDVLGVGHAQVITGAGPGGGPQVKVIDSTSGSVLATFLAYDSAFAGGVRVGTVDLTNSGQFKILTGPGPGGGADLKIYEASNHQLLDEFFVFDPAFVNGIFFGGN
jgi:hypothetical protein